MTENCDDHTYSWGEPESDLMSIPLLETLKTSVLADPKYQFNLKYSKSIKNECSFMSLIEEVKMDFIKNKLKKIARLQYKTQKFSSGSILYKMKEMEKDLEEKDLVQTAVKNNNLYVWVTINPDWEKIKKKIKLKKPPRAKVIQLFRDICIQKFSSAMYTDSIFVLEQRRTVEGEGPLGLHVHALCKRKLGKTYPPSNVRRGIRNAFKTLCNTKNDALCKIDFIGPEFARDKKEYILGKKTGKKKDGESKSSAQKLDQDMRKKYLNSVQFYGNMPDI